VPRLRSVNVVIDPLAAAVPHEEDEFEMRARRALACDTRQTERILKIEGDGDR
jgi:hypothetical protein